MLLGHIDTITAAGYVEGWAFDEADPLTPLQIAIHAAGAEVARGLANLWRHDLAHAACGCGWNAFRLKLSGAPLTEAAEIALHALPSGAEIHRAEKPRFADETPPKLTSLEALARADPTLLHAAEQWRGCGAAFAAFIETAGIESFIATAYMYVLGRPADAPALAFHLACLREESMTPHDVLAALHASAEFSASPNLLAAPSDPGFPFRLP